MDEEGNDNGFKASKELLLKIVDDPYFQYLVEKKARAQTRTFLATAGTIILAVLAYGGLEFKSAKDEIAAKQTEFNQMAKEKGRIIEETTKQITQNSQQMQHAVNEIASKIDQSQTLVNQAQNQLLAGKRDADQFNSMQTQLLTTQQKLLEQSMSVSNNAFGAAKDADRILKELRDSDIPKKLTQVESLVEASKRSKKAVDDALVGVKPLQEVNLDLLKARASELFLLRENREYTVVLPDVSNLSGTLTQIKMTFKVGSINMFGKPIITYNVQRSDRPNYHNSQWYSWKIKNPDQQESIQIVGTPFEAVFLQMYSGVFSPELLVIKIQPT